MNRKLAPDIHTVFLMSSFAHIYVSSSILKDIASYGGNVSDLRSTSCRESAEGEVQIKVDGAA